MGYRRQSRRLKHLDNCAANLNHIGNAAVKYLSSIGEDKPDMEVLVRDYLGGHEPTCNLGGKYTFVQPVVDGKKLTQWCLRCGKHGVYNPYTQQFVKSTSSSSRAAVVRHSVNWTIDRREPGIA